MDRFRVLAGLLSVGGVFWGLYLLPYVLIPNLLTLLFAPGYLITAGYIKRACSQPSDRMRMLIWGGSALVQGYWLMGCIPNFSLYIHLLSFIDDSFVIAIGWWAFSFVVSIWGLCSDRRAKKFTEPELA